MNTILKKTVFAALCSVSLGAAAKDVDPESGFIIAPDWELVKAQCTVCHSSKLVTAQRGSRKTWESIIRWMQATQGLWQFEPEMERKIFDYLAANYPPGDGYRRKPLPPELRPPQ
ncbi:hypothetical protein [Denitromonas halophila]|uniref:Cytochrome C n=1 Tax=Denitromonas halophila TaxID=1629404 RepID=A0A557QZB2_9RHOO|nr:hypothetical protein [Denitromonas halophila]TVO58249.1 hypothetical protein FHP91_05950 [Denitromonas halophila]